MDFEDEILKIKERNARVEKDKAWETSIARKALIAAITYMLISIFLIQIKNEAPFINAIIPTAAFILSTLAIEPAKKFWIKLKYKE